MRMEMTFDPAAVPEGYTIGNVYHTVKTEFMKHGLRCCSDGDVLAFEDNGREDGYAYMWNAVISLLKSKGLDRCGRIAYNSTTGERKFSSCKVFRHR